jgi:signal transduction histidine kinase
VASIPQPVLDLRRAMQSDSSGFFDKTYPITNFQTGGRRIIRANGQVLFGADGSALSITGTAQDVTEQEERHLALETEVQVRTEELASAVEELRATNEELEEANTQLRHSNEELAQYAYVASHDLQEPLRKIRIFTDMVASRAELSPGTKATVAKISQSAERMSLLIQDLLAFSRLLKSDRLVRPVSLRETVEAVWSDYELKVEELGATLELGDLPSIEGVNLQVNQLFYNLLGNALKFVRPGVAPYIKVESAAAGEDLKARHLETPLLVTDYYHLQVTDNGIGFNTEYAEQIFEVFKRLHGRDMYPGSGIGLALCRRIAANHNGALWADSVVGEGTTFHLLLPARQHQTVSEFGTTFDFPNP